MVEPDGLMLNDAPLQMVADCAVTTGVGLTMMTNSALGPSHPSGETWLTKTLKFPASAVDGTGAWVTPVPPDEFAYHNKV